MVKRKHRSNLASGLQGCQQVTNCHHRTILRSTQSLESAWRILGTDPSQFYFGQSHTHGAFGNVGNASVSFLEDHDEQDLVDQNALEMAVFRRFRLAANTSGAGKMEEDAARHREQILTLRQQRKISPTTATTWQVGCPEIYHARPCNTYLAGKRRHPAQSFGV
uniref:Uncharacterized protein n=1 Tax=Phaeodactylum tricornutum TaxID=2850 RepID=A0A8J9SL03_PHATR